MLYAFPRSGPGRVRVRIVGGPHQVLDAGELSGVDAHAVHDECRRYVAREVFAGLQIGMDAVLKRVALVAAVEARQQPGQPAGVGFGHHQAHARVAIEQGAREDFTERQHYLHRIFGISRRAALFPGEAEVRLAVAGKRVNADRQADVRRRRPQRIVERVAVLRAFRRHGGDHRAAQSALRPALQILHRMVHVVYRDQRQPHQPVGRLAAHLHQPFVVGVERRFLQLGVRHGVEIHRIRAVQHFAGDAVDFLVLEPLHRVVAARPQVLVLDVLELDQLLFRYARRRYAVDGPGSDAVAYEPCARLALVIGNEARSPLAEFPVKPRLPQVHGLEYMRVRGDYRVLSHGSSAGSGKR